MIKDEVQFHGRLQFFVNEVPFQEVDNLIVTTGRQYIASVLAAGTGYAGYYMAIGTSAVAPVLADTALQAEVGVRVAGTRSSSGSSFSVESVFPQNNPSGSLTNISEAGLFTAASGGILVARATFAPVPKESLDTLRIIWTVTAS